MRHLREMAASLADHDRAVILYCLYYEITGFRYYRGTTYDEVMRTVQACRDIELWQASFKLIPECMVLSSTRLCHYLPQRKPNLGWSVQDQTDFELACIGLVKLANQHRSKGIVLISGKF